MEVQVLQLRHGGHEARRQRRQLIVGQVEVLQGGKVEVAQQREGGEGCRVQLLKPVALQLQQPQGGEAVEGVRVDELQVVVIQVQSGQRPQTAEGVSVDLLQLVVADLEHLNEYGEKRGQNRRWKKENSGCLQDKIWLIAKWEHVIPEGEFNDESHSIKNVFFVFLKGEKNSTFLQRGCKSYELDRLG